MIASVAYGLMMAGAYDRREHRSIRCDKHRSRHALPGQHSADRYEEDQYGEKPRHLTFPLVQ